MALGWCPAPPEDVAPRRVTVALDVGRSPSATALPRVRAPLLWPGTATQPVVAQAWTTRWRAATRVHAHREEYATASFPGQVTSRRLRGIEWQFGPVQPARMFLARSVGA